MSLGVEQRLRLLSSLITVAGVMAFGAAWNGLDGLLILGGAASWVWLLGYHVGLASRRRAPEFPGARPGSSAGDQRPAGPPPSL